jgi:hypothetical protein
MKLFKDESLDIKYITEAREDGKKNVYIEGTFLQAEKQNKNGRIYRRPIMEREVGRYQDLIKEKRALGELGHPPNPTVNLNNVSHLITDLRFNGNDVVGKAKILETPMGLIAKNFLDEGVKLGVSSRGLGSLKMVNGVNEVQDDYHLATIDIVSDPSGPDCWVSGIMESAEWAFVDGRGWVETKNSIDQIVRETKYNKSKRDEDLLEAMNSFFRNLK